MSDKWFSPLLRPGEAFREETNGRLLIWTWTLLLIGVGGMLFWVATESSVAGAFALCFGFVGGALHSLVQLRAAGRRRKAGRNDEPG